MVMPALCWLQERNRVSGYGFPGEREMKKPSRNSVGAWLRVLCILQGMLVCITLCPAQTHCEDWFRTTLNWYRYSTVQKLCPCRQLQ